MDDPNFRFRPAAPAFQKSKGPVVCIDEAHNNFHTADGRYRPFAELLRTDGYQVRGLSQKLTAEAVAPCQLLIIANAIADANQSDWAFPHPSAFTRKEIEFMYGWLNDGGRLLMFVDHAPMPGSARDLLTVLGAIVIDGYARNSTQQWPDRFHRKTGLLKDHPITRGRTPAEHIDTVSTFTGHAFQVTTDFAPLMVFGPNATVSIHLKPNFPNLPKDRHPKFPVAGWVHGAARSLGRGRLVLLGEAAMCTAQTVGSKKIPIGMNHPQATQNPQFCLNAMHWLTGVLTD